MTRKLQTLVNEELEPQVQTAVDACRRLLVDLEIERKRAVLHELERWIALEEASFEPQQ